LQEHISYSIILTESDAIGLEEQRSVLAATWIYQ